MVLLLVFMQLTRDLFAIAKSLLRIRAIQMYIYFTYLGYLLQWTLDTYRGLAVA